MLGPEGIQPGGPSDSLAARCWPRSELWKPRCESLSARVACEAAKEVVVAENVRTFSMRARNSLVERVMYYGGYAEVLGPAISDRTEGMKPEFWGEVEGIEDCGAEARATRVVVGGAEETGGNTGETGTGGSPVCSTIREKSR